MATALVCKWFADRSQRESETKIMHQTNYAENFVQKLNQFSFHVLFHPSFRWFNFNKLVEWNEKLCESFHSSFYFSIKLDQKLILNYNLWRDDASVFLFQVFSEFTQARNFGKLKMWFENSFHLIFKVKEFDGMTAEISSATNLLLYFRFFG